MKPSPKIVIRYASAVDVDVLADLATQLGYPSTPEQALRRLEILQARPDENAVFVAETNGRVAGWVHAHIYSLLVADPEVEIGGLVVGESARGQKIGEQLMKTAETWAREHGCSSVYLRSNTIRTRAHKFYKRLGYTIVKSQYAFRKNI